MEIRKINGDLIIRRKGCSTKGELVKYCVENKISLGYANLKGIDLSGINLTGGDFNSANLNSANFNSANLSYANFEGAYLEGSNLGYANLSFAYLSGAYLNNANLSSTELDNANLSYAYLRGAYLNNANLSSADLNNANLSGAYLNGADLGNTNLNRVNFKNASLGGAYLRYSNSTNVLTNHATAFFSLQCPEEGAFIGYKKANGCLIKLLITEGSKRNSGTSRKCRCSKVKVLEIKNIKTNKIIDSVFSDYDKNFEYKTNNIIEVKNFNEDRWIERTSGIHFFITKEEAINF